MNPGSGFNPFRVVEERGFAYIPRVPTRGYSLVTPLGVITYKS